MSEISDQIMEMTSLITANTSAPVTEVSSTDAPSTDAPGTKSPSTEAPSTESPSTKAPSTEAPTTDAPDEYTELREENRLLEERLKKLENPSTDAPGTLVPSTDTPIGEEDFIGDIDLDELTRDSSKLNSILNAVLKKGVELGREYARTGDEKVLLSVPEMTKRNIEIVTELKKASEEFYTANADLKPFKKVVSLVFEEESSKNPDKKYSEILETIGPEVRKRLDLQKKADDKNLDKGPKLPKKKAQPRQPLYKPEPDSFDSEIDKMNEALNS